MVHRASDLEAWDRSLRMAVLDPGIGPGIWDRPWSIGSVLEPGIGHGAWNLKSVLEPGVGPELGIGPAIGPGAPPQIALGIGHGAGDRSWSL